MFGFRPNLTGGSIQFPWGTLGNGCRARDDGCSIADLWSVWLPWPYFQCYLEMLAALQPRKCFDAGFGKAKRADGLH